MADSYIHDSSRTPGVVAELAATRKEVKYSMLAGTHIFQLLAFESYGPQNASAISFIKILVTELHSGPAMLARPSSSFNGSV